MTKRWLILGTISALVLVALAIAACSPQQRAALQAVVGTTAGNDAHGTAVAQVPATAAIDTVTPPFSQLATPTPAPTLAGPMGTLTAIAELVASPTQDTEPYVIENRGNPHFLEFHAWW